MSVTAMAPKTGGPEAGAQGKKKQGKKKLVVLTGMLVVLLALGGAGSWFLLKPPAGSGPSHPTPGVVVKLDPIQLNLDGGHYLRIGIALQLTDKASSVDGSKALDATISLFSGRSTAELADPAQREKLKQQLVTQLSALYDGQVMNVYFTDFVTQ